MFFFEGIRGQVAVDDVLGRSATELLAMTLVDGALCLVSIREKILPELLKYIKYAHHKFERIIKFPIFCVSVKIKYLLH